jgi:hypothetical protein
VTKKCNNTIVTIVDSLTKRVWWVATKEAELTAEKFVRLFIDYHIRAYGIPTAIVIDQNICFQSISWEAFTKAVYTRDKFSMAFHL